MDLIATTKKGEVIHFRLDRNRHCLVASCGLPGSSLLFSKTVLGDVFVALQDGTVSVYNTYTRSCKAVLRGHGRPVHHLACSAAEDLLVSTSTDAVLLWDLANNHRLCTLVGQPHGAVMSSILPGDAIVVTVFKDGTTWLWKTASRQVLQKTTKPANLSGVSCITASCSPNGSTLVTGTAEPALLVQRISGKPGCQALCAVQYIIHLPQSAASAIHVEFMGDSLTVAVLCGDGGLWFVDVVASTLCYKICPPGEGAKFVEMSLATDGNHVAVISDIGQMFVYDLRTVRNTAAKNNLHLLRKTPARDATVESLGLTNCRKSTSKKPASHATTSQSSAVSCTELETSHMCSTSPNILGSGTGMFLSYLRLHETFPDRHRLAIWQHLLHVPHGASAFQEVSRLGIHPAFAQLDAGHYRCDSRLLGRLQRVLSALAFWQPCLAIFAALPTMALPFVILCSADTGACFEVIAAVLKKWLPGSLTGSHGPQYRQLRTAAFLLQLYDSQLFWHISKGSVGFVGFMQPMLYTLLGNVLAHSHWLQVWDIAVASPPSHFIYMVLALLINQRKSICQSCKLATSGEEAFSELWSAVSDEDLKKVTRLASQLQKMIDSWNTSDGTCGLPHKTQTVN